MRVALVVCCDPWWVHTRGGVRACDVPRNCRREIGFSSSTMVLLTVHWSACLHPLPLAHLFSFIVFVVCLEGFHLPLFQRPYGVLSSQIIVHCIINACNKAENSHCEHEWLRPLLVGAAATAGSCEPCGTYSYFFSLSHLIKYSQVTPMCGVAECSP